jgi:uncharacterized NAD(P)/FAD-binding protein YdhS
VKVPNISPDRIYDVAIVGGGFSGTALATRLLRCLPSGHSIVVVDRFGTPGRGVAYGTDCRFHLLNVRASDMSAVADEPDHFLLWLRKNVDASTDADHFVRRFLFGQYLREMLRDELVANKEVFFSWLIDQVIAVDSQRGLAVLKMQAGSEVRARFAVLATGNSPPTTPLQLKRISPRRYAPYAWSNDVLAKAPSSGTILLLGTGLTAVDMVLALRAQNFDGNILMLSTHGILPGVHNAAASEPSSWTLGSSHTIRSLFSAVRQEVSAASARGIPWHSVIDSLRPVTQRIWKSLPPVERKRFLRHVRVYWEIHRHRIPPESYVILEELIARGRVTILGGRLLTCVESNDRVRVTLQERRSRKEMPILANFVINCSGHGKSSQLIQEPAVRSMLALRIARIDTLGLGLDVAENGALIDDFGKPASSFFAIGPLRKGCLWETTAVPEIRSQVKELADHILRRLTCRTRE